MSQHHHHPHGHNPNPPIGSVPIGAPSGGKTEPRRRPTREEINKRAYDSYLREGAKDGNDLFHWLEAEADLTAGCTRPQCG